jgi:hypothetical protein
MTARQLAPILIAVATLIPLAGAANEPLRVLAIGSVTPENTPIVHWCEDEPLASATIIPTRLGGATYDAEHAMRLIRLYFPRRFDKTTVDLVIFSAGDVVFLTTSQIADITSGVEGGVGAIADCGGTSVITQSINSWVASGIGEIFPNDVSAVLSASYGFTTGTYPGYFLKEVPYKINVREEVSENPFSSFLPVGIEDVHGWAGRNMVSKPGSTILANVVGNVGFLKQETPFSLSWQYGSGTTVAVSEWFGHPFWSDYGGLAHQSDNAYATELFVNLLLHVTGKPLFVDVVEIHRIKEDVQEYRIRRGNLISVIDFASRFGVNPTSIEEDLGRMEETKRDADALYMEGEYAQASAALRSVISDLEAAFDRSIDLKNRALIYVYVIEWIAVTSVLVISGSAVFELMVRRKTYKEVATTTTR